NVKLQFLNSELFTMCWAIPVQIKSIEQDTGRIEADGTEREVGLQLIDNPQVGDWVLIHAGFAIQKIDENEARETLELWDEMAESVD
ncbi:MAG: HypC/HybG/HupF family hydrogenase formation chaperone, partial [Planctomycetota bacterium]